MFLNLQTSLVSAHKLETWLEHGSEATMTVDALRQFEVLVTKDKVSHGCNQLRFSMFASLYSAVPCNYCKADDLLCRLTSVSSLALSTGFR